MTTEKEIMSETAEINVEKNNDSAENNIVENTNNNSNTTSTSFLDEPVLKYGQEDIQPSNSQQMFHFTGDGNFNISVFDAGAITNQIISTDGTSGSKKGNFEIIYNSGGAYYPDGVSDLEDATLFSKIALNCYNLATISNDTLNASNASKLKCSVFSVNGNVESAISTLKTDTEKASGYSLTAACASFNVPTGSVTYYFGNLYTRTPSTTAYSSRAITIPKSGQLKFASVNWARDDSPDPNTINPTNDGPKIGIKINSGSVIQLFNFNDMISSAGGNQSVTLLNTLNKDDVVWIVYSSNFWTSGVNALSLHVNLFIETNY